MTPIKWQWYNLTYLGPSSGNVILRWTRLTSLNYEGWYLINSYHASQGLPHIIHRESLCSTSDLCFVLLWLACQSVGSISWIADVLQFTYNQWPLPRRFLCICNHHLGKSLLHHFPDANAQSYWWPPLHARTHCWADQTSYSLDDFFFLHWARSITELGNIISVVSALLAGYSRLNNYY